MIGLVTATAARHVDFDLPALLAELPEADVVVWDDPAVDWSRYEVVVIRSTWDYHERRHEFLSWARETTTRTRLWNPIALLEWNTDKRYLGELADRGIPAVDTRFVERGRPIDADLVDSGGELVVKPSIGAGSNGVLRTRDPEAVRAHVRSLHERGLTAMVQPYLGAADEVGETDLVYLGGEYSHAFRKSVKLDPDAPYEGLTADEAVAPHVATDDERAVGDRVMATLPPTAYARVDLLPSPAGPVVLELELTEPSLFLEGDPASPARAAAVFRSLAR